MIWLDVVSIRKWHYTEIVVSTELDHTTIEISESAPDEWMLGWTKWCISIGNEFVVCNVQIRSPIGMIERNICVVGRNVVFPNRNNNIFPPKYYYDVCGGSMIRHVSIKDIKYWLHLIEYRLSTNGLMCNNQYPPFIKWQIDCLQRFEVEISALEIQKFLFCDKCVFFLLEPHRKIFN